MITENTLWECNKDMFECEIADCWHSILKSALGTWARQNHEKIKEFEKINAQVVTAFKGRHFRMQYIDSQTNAVMLSVYILIDKSSKDITIEEHYKGGVQNSVMLKNYAIAADIDEFYACVFPCSENKLCWHNALIDGGKRLYQYLFDHYDDETIKSNLCRGWHWETIKEEIVLIFYIFLKNCNSLPLEKFILRFDRDKMEFNFEDNDGKIQRLCGITVQKNSHPTLH